jgi:hypothetical protein
VVEVCGGGLLMWRCSAWLWFRSVDSGFANKAVCQQPAGSHGQTAKRGRRLGGEEIM